ncbi:RES domain-containing protein [Type-E symbiont of Plautia stali]|uniref:RES domain-containing protein n=1 Tax=Type-E symbiont of Plautia stali TaxID=1560357 RepID=UPI001428C2C0|nr:RES domain-containing protein [Type-E symbiont of Plautia stali]
MNEEKYICHACVGEEYISKLIMNTGKAKRNCSYCRKRKKNVPLEELVPILHKMFMEHYEQPEDGPFYHQAGDPAVDIIQDQLSVDEQAAKDLLSSLEDENNDLHGLEIIYDETYNYIKVNRSENALGIAWEKLEESLKKESRYFNHQVKDFLDQLFTDIDKLQTKKNQSAILTPGIDMTFYRARVFENEEDVVKALQHPERYFGPPPHDLAPSGRMNARGIPVFYGSTSPEIAVAEVRPVVGSFVVVVPFRTLCEMRILDISALKSLREVGGSIFDDQVAIRNDKANFMRTLARKLTLPASGRNPENDYLITQAVAEYLSQSEESRLDGISFNSTQHPTGKGEREKHQNVVLFSKSARIMGAEPNSRSYQVELYDNVEDDRWVFSPTIEKVEVNKRTKYSFSYFSEKLNPSLQIRSDQIVIHKVKGVSYETSQSGITLIVPLQPE